MNEKLFKNKGIQFGVLYAKFRHQIRKASNNLTYTTYLKIMNSEKALRVYSDNCFSAFSNYQLNVARDMANKDSMINDLIERNHKNVAMLKKLQKQVGKSNSLSDSASKSAKLSRAVKNDQIRINRLLKRCGTLLATNSKYLKQINSYRGQIKDDQHKLAAKPKVKIVKVPQQSQQKPAQKSQLNSNAGHINPPHKPSNPFAGPHTLQQESDERAQRNRSQGNSQESSSNDVPNNRLAKLRKRASVSDSSINQNDLNKQAKGSNQPHSSASSSSVDPTSLANKSYSVDSHAADSIIDGAKKKMYVSGDSESDNGSENSADNPDTDSDKGSGSADSKSDDSSKPSDKGPTLG